MTKDNVRIEVFFTKTKKFRARIVEGSNPPYEVTIGGTAWKAGKGSRFYNAVRFRCMLLADRMQAELRRNFYNTKGETDVKANKTR